MIYWLLRYFSVFHLLISLVLDFEIFIIFFNIITLHLFYGIVSIWKDYIHQFEIRLFLLFLGRVLILIISNIIIEVIF